MSKSVLCDCFPTSEKRIGAETPTRGRLQPIGDEVANPVSPRRCRSAKACPRFLNETDGSQTAFLDGNQPDRLCAPMREHIERLGGEVRTGAPVREFRLHEDGSVAESARAQRHYEVFK